MIGPRLLMIAGSGETAPRMAPIHRSAVERFRSRLGRPIEAVLLDTPYGFQENADHLTERIVRYFGDRVGLAMRPVLMPRAGDGVQEAAATEAVRRADFVFAGPGSPSYALLHWRRSGIDWALREKLERGGALSFASAAAITMGAFAAPIYEIYKAGHDPAWSPGLDLLGACGLLVAVVPHFDNTEGGQHDTRYCYIGERRFRQLEERLPADAWVLGIDERTALIVDLDEGFAEVKGPGKVTVRRRGRERHLSSGTRFPISALSPARKRSAASAVTEPSAESGERSFSRALDANDLQAVVAAILELERTAEWPRGRNGEGARHALRSAVLRLGELADRARSERAVVEALVGSLLEVRARARGDEDWTTADEIRTALAGAGLSIRDTDGGPVWERSSQPAAERPGRRP